jgi:opacity protein-like surface antigen
MRRCRKATGRRNAPRRGAVPFSPTAAGHSLGLRLSSHRRADGSLRADKADDAAQLAQIAATLKKLEARVDTLEGEYKHAKQETAEARAEAQALRLKLARSKAASGQTATGTTAAPTRFASIATTDATTAPPGLYAMATKAPYAVEPGWGGIYAGAAFGLGWLHANENFTETEPLVTSFSGTGFSDVDTGITSNLDTLSGQSLGAMSTLFVGYNYMLNSRYVVGVQAEGGLANARANLSGTGTEISTATVIDTPPGGAAGTTVTNSTSTSTGLIDQIDNRWMASLLLRGGALVDPGDLVYLLGGYTYGRFDDYDVGSGFGLSGGTVGVGWERQIVPGWTLRGEYRYTRFQNKTVTLGEQFASTSSSTGATSSSSSETGSFSEAFQFSGVDMQSIWLGVAHQFGTR